MCQRKADGLFFWGEPAAGGITLHDFATGDAVGDVADKADVEQLKPNAGIRGDDRLRRWCSSS